MVAAGISERREVLDSRGEKEYSAIYQMPDYRDCAPGFAQ